MHPNPICAFGPFRLDARERLLLRDGHTIALTPKAFDLLLYLVDRPGRLVEKHALMAAIWPDAIVEEGNLATTVSALRKALGDDGDEHRVIATVPTRGYRFVMPVDAAAQPVAGSHRSTARLPRTVAVALWSIVMIGVGWILAERLASPVTALMFVRVGIEPADGIRGPDLHGEQWGARNHPTRTAIVLSPDGRRLVFTGLRDGQQQLWMRSLDRAEATPIAGTDQAAAPFFSPDGRWIGFWSRGALWKVLVDGGAAVKICAARLAYGASWGTDDRIVFADEPDSGLRRVAAAGGVAETLTTVNVARGEGSHRFPHVLPGGNAVVFTIVAVPNEPRLGTYVALLSLETGQRRVLFRDAADARYVPTGHLVYASNRTLMAAPFDLRTLRVTGGAVGLMNGIMQGVNGTIDLTTAAQFTVSATGSLAWMPNPDDPNPEQFRTIVWVDRHGRSTPVGAAEDAYYQPRVAPDGRHIAVHTLGSVAAIWLYDIDRATRTRLPFDGFASNPLWTPDGTRIVFGGSRAGVVNLFWIPADGSGPATRLNTSDVAQLPASWTPDGRTLVFHQCSSQCDIWALTMNGTGTKVWPVLQTPAQEWHATLSPDGRWLAYMSNESGRPEVYVQPFPGPGARHQISTEGGLLPRWSSDGRQLFYCAMHRAGPLPVILPIPARTGHTYLVADVSASPAFTASAPRVLFEDPEMKYTVTQPIAGYDVAPDGRFLMVEVKRGPGVVPPPPVDVRLIVNWSEQLRTRVPSR